MARTTRYIIVGCLTLLFVGSLLFDTGAEFLIDGWLKAPMRGRVCVSVSNLSIRFMMPTIYYKQPGPTKFAVGRIRWNTPPYGGEPSGLSFGSVRPWKSYHGYRWSGLYFVGFGFRTFEKHDLGFGPSSPTNPLLWTGTEFQIPTWAGLIIAWFLLPRRLKMITSQCIQCHYDLRGSLDSANCPECGTWISDAQKERVRAELVSKPKGIR